MTKVSVIVPIYNMEVYVKECLDSILSQTLKEIGRSYICRRCDELCGQNSGGCGAAWS